MYSTQATSQYRSLSSSLDEESNSNEPVDPRNCEAQFEENDALDVVEKNTSRLFFHLIINIIENPMFTVVLILLLTNGYWVYKNSFPGHCGNIKDYYYGISFYRFF